VKSSSMFNLISIDLEATEFTRKEVERYSHETKCSDGEMYKRIRFYQTTGQYDLMQESLMTGLTPCKRKVLIQFLKKKSYVELLDYLFILTFDLEG
jgi:hypothetical protein